jgi:putative peptidoglycan lipid II flippase
MIKRESLRRGSFSTSLLNVVGRGIGFFSVFLVSYLFGANSHTDVFYFLLSFTLLITTLFTNLYSSVFLPLFIKIKEQKNNHEAWQFLNSLFTYTVIFSVLLGCVYYFWAVEIIGSFSNFNPEILILSKDILAFFAPVISLMILVEFLKTVIQSQYQFTLPALSVLFNSVVNILLLIALGKIFGVKIMAISIVISYLLQFIFLFQYIKRHEPLFVFSFNYNKNHSSFLKLSAPIIVTQLFSIASMFYYDYSATIFSAGTLTSIALAQKVFSLPQDMIISPLSNIVAPVFSENAATNSYEKFTENFLRYNNLIWLVIIPISFFFIFFSESIIRLLFIRGAYTNEDARVSVITLQLFSIGLFGYSFHAIATRAFFAMQKTFWLSIISFVISLISIAITYITVKEFGYPGISLSRTLSVILLSVGSSVLLLKYYIPEFKLLRIFLPFLKMTAGALAASLASNFLFQLIYSYSFFKTSFSNTIVSFCFAAPVFILVYTFACYLLKVNVFLEAFSLIKNKISLNHLKFFKI